MGIVLLAGCMGYSSIGGLYGVLLYRWAVWGIALLVGCIWGIALLVGCMGYSSIGGMYGV